MTKTNTSALVVPSPGTNAPAMEGTLRDIRPPIAVPSGWSWLGWVAAAVAAYLLARAWWRRKRRPIPIPPVPVVPAHEQALERLRRARALIDQPRPYCIEVSDAIRAYLENRFDLHAPDRTTEEFLEELQASPKLMWTQKQTLGEFLGRCDLVKFARYEPSHAEREGLLEIAVRLVSETQPSAPGPDRSPSGPDATASAGASPKTGVS